MLEIIFWSLLALVFYTYVGYGIISYMLVSIKRVLTRGSGKSHFTWTQLPKVTLIVAAYNEEACIEDKIQNSFLLDYPKDSIDFLFITDGSDDRTMEIISRYPGIRLLHQKKRQGKVAAVNRAMRYVKSPIVVFTDANTIINKDAIKRIVHHYQDPVVGAVAGEKKILMESADNASSAGEGIYWKYESLLKKWDSEINSVVGAAGELFSIRTSCFENIKEDTIIEDFFLTLRIAQKGYKVVYEPGAYAMERSSLSVKEELKRKIRISAGGIQAIVRLSGLLNIFKYGILSFQYISHRVLRWTLSPVALLLIFIINFILIDIGHVYGLLFIGQIIFYILAFTGYLFENYKIRIRMFFVPYYFVIMNYSVFAGFFRYIGGKQSALWIRAERKMT